MQSGLPVECAPLADVTQILLRHRLQIRMAQEPPQVMGASRTAVLTCSSPHKFRVAIGVVHGHGAGARPARKLEAPSLFDGLVVCVHCSGSSLTDLQGSVGAHLVS